MRGWFIWLLVAAPMLAQYGSLSTTQSGAEVYFDTTMPRTGTGAHRS
jgi:hypothetical protein